MAEPRQATFTALLAVREYRPLFVADILSVIGDQIAIVALSLLVYQRTGSPLLTALVYTLEFLPWIAGGPALAALADRWPRRGMLIGCALLQFLFIGVAAIPGLPVPVLLVLVGLAALLSPPFEAARGALLPEILDDDRYVLATSVSVITHQVGALIGVVAGGALVAFLSAEGALLIDAVTFLLTALLVAVGVTSRPTVQPETETATSLWQDTIEGIRFVLAHDEVRRLILLVWLNALFLIVPDALAPGYVEQLGRGPESVGVFLAAGSAGLIVGSAILTRLVGPSRRLQVMRPLALLSMLPLFVIILRPGFAVSVACLALSGAFSAAMIPARAAVMTAVAPSMRGRVFGVAASGLALSQVVGGVLAGAVAQVVPSYVVIAGSGVVGLLCIALVIPSTAAVRALDSDDPPTAE